MANTTNLVNAIKIQVDKTGSYTMTNKTMKTMFGDNYQAAEKFFCKMSSLGFSYHIGTNEHIIFTR